MRKLKAIASSGLISAGMITASQLVFPFLTTQPAMAHHTKSTGNWRYTFYTVARYPNLPAKGASARACTVHEYLAGGSKRWNTPLCKPGNLYLQTAVDPKTGLLGRSYSLTFYYPYHGRTYTMRAYGSDTGGAIKGNKIDIYVNTVRQAVAGAGGGRNAKVRR